MRNQEPDNSIFSFNLLVLAAVVLAKAVLSLAFGFFLSNYMVIDIVASAAFLVALAMLYRLGIIRAGALEGETAEAEKLTVRSVASALKGIALVLAGFLLCQAVLGMGWAAELFGRSSVVLQTRESFAFVQCGAVLCALSVLLVRKHVRNTVNFHYFAILLCLLLLVVPWISADLAGELRIMVTALPWGFCASFLAILLVLDLASMQRSLAIALGCITVLADVLCIVLAGALLLWLGDEVVNAMSRTLLVALIALAALEILREYQHLEKQVEKTSERFNGELFARYKLTNREQEVFVLLLQGRRATWIAQKLYISDNTARAHVKHIYQKFGVHSREELLDLVENAGSERA